MNRRSRQWGASLGLWLVATTIACAQQAAGLKLEKHFDAAQAAQGDRVRLTLTLTNEGSAALEDLTVREVTPVGTRFSGAASPPGWSVTTPAQGEKGEVIWHSTAPLGPGERAELAILVTIEVVEGDLLSSPGFTAQAGRWSEPLTSPDVILPLLAPTATPVPATIETESDWLWPAAGGGVLLIVSTIVVWTWVRQRA